MKNKNNNNKRGYTIIETMVAVSLFLVIVTIGMGSLMSANLVYNKSQNMRSILDNLSFVMEDMSRNLRIGYDFHCITGGIVPLGVQSPASCPTSPLGWGISFKSGYDGSQWVYYINTNPNYSSRNSVFRSVDGMNFVQMTPDEIDIDDTSSGFTVTGALSGDNLQPFVTIKLVGSITYKGVASPFSIQTSVSQRELDI